MAKEELYIKYLISTFKTSDYEVEILKKSIKINCDNFVTEKIIALFKIISPTKFDFTNIKIKKQNKYRDYITIPMLSPIVEKDLIDTANRLNYIFVDHIKPGYFYSYNDNVSYYILANKNGKILSIEFNDVLNRVNFSSKNYGCIPKQPQQNIDKRLRKAIKFLFKNKIDIYDWVLSSF